MEKRRAAIYGTTLVAAFVVGLLIGDRVCSGNPETRVEEKIVERTVPVASPDVCACGPDAGAGTADSAPPVEPRSPEQKSAEALPEAPRPPDPTTRRKLLAWVRDRSSALQPCRPESLTESRYTVTFELSDDGTVDGVDINAPEKEVSREVLECLRRRMTGWEPPPDLIEGRRKLVFGLKL